MPLSLFWSKALHRALAAADHGLPVFPLAPNKLPALRSPHPGELCRGECGLLGHGVHDASSDPIRVHHLFKSAPRATGYGIACGVPQRWVVGVDLDRKNGVDGVAALNALTVRHSFTLTPTITVLTPSGGLHMYYATPAGTLVPNSASRVAPGIDIRGAGGYLVGPGSWTRKGVYEAISEPHADIEAVPAALLDLATAEEHKTPRPVAVPMPRDGADRGEALVRFVLEAPEGELNNRLFWAACRAFEQYQGNEGIAAELLRAACAKGHPERGAARTIDSAKIRAGRSAR
ncbi:bifunctional DNA primase/polymerase [Streptomyces sp. NBC_00272]|uniref:bifunctional DNA primase/polymerase n=1 Tax=Streptomyces sp. NBC_00272 TaxID=2975698 RepID=UPI002E29DE0F|nr:bifunctional DNA primase/polymerase [Streptomyces sp. NBC_00272]